MRLRNTRARMCMTTTSPTTSSNWGLSKHETSESNIRIELWIEKKMG
jgi:hypothetical protein